MIAEIVMTENVINAIAEAVAEKLKATIHDGCKGCVYEGVEEWEMPCNMCKQSCKDYYRAKERK